MAVDTKYNLAWLPGVANSEFVADYSLNFSTFSSTVIYLQGSYNLIDIQAKTIYVNNKQNNNIVTLSANLSNGNSPYVRQVPPFGEAYLPIATYQQITLAANAGVTTVEISNQARDETIFQRTDTSSQIININGTTTAVNGDLVTINSIGQLATCVASTVAGNNTTVNFPAAATWGSSATIGFWGMGGTYVGSNSHGLKDSNGNLIMMEGNNVTVNWSVNTYKPGGTSGVAVSAWGSAAEVWPSVIETQTYIACTYANVNSVYRYIKATGLGLTTITPLSFSGVTLATLVSVMGGNLATDVFYVVGQNNADTTDLRILTINAAGAPSAITAKIPITANSWTGGCVMSATLGNGKLVITGHIGSGGYYMRYLVVDPTNSFAVSANYSSNTLSANNPTNTVSQMQPLVVGNTAVFGYNSDVSTYHGVFINAAGVANDVVIDNAITVTNGCSGPILTTDGNVVFVHRVTGIGMVVRKYSMAGVLLSSLVLNAAAAVGTGVYVCATNGDNILIGVNTDNTYVFNGVTMTLVGSITYGFDTTQQMYSISYATGFVTFGVGAGKTLSHNWTYDLAKSIFGVYRGSGNVQLTGDMNINQFYAGATAFNQNGATVVGNRGLILNNVASLRGLQP